MTLKIFYTDHYVLPLPEGHRFPMAKYGLLRKRIEEAGLANGAGLREPHAATDEEILRAHDRDYLERVVSGRLSAQELRRTGFPWTPQMVERRAVPPAPPLRPAALRSPKESE